MTMAVSASPRTLGMNKQTIFKSLAKHYDQLYSWKDYKKEVDIIRALIRPHKQSLGTDLLEVACGTGKHAELTPEDAVQLCAPSQGRRHRDHRAMMDQGPATGSELSP
jgi:hypothetical protein